MGTILSSNREPLLALPKWGQRKPLRRQERVPAPWIELRRWLPPRVRRRRELKFSSQCLKLEPFLSMKLSIVKKASVLVVVALSAVATVSAQAMAPAPSPDAGAAFSIPASGVMIGTSLVLSFVALLRN
ncbi:unnamed protein product [Lactuca virosa]|uniref:Uncharacterized protein n=1 Tax=Lactuca virosa TaxID=75947 RepID=A0AAU9P8Y0_9ASTR|nr:unnamed protein product [Lactuca virosa]